jgi:hypothetical protein
MVKEKNDNDINEETYIPEDDEIAEETNGDIKVNNDSPEVRMGRVDYPDPIICLGRPI